MSDELTVRIAEVLAAEFGSFLAHDPHNPERFYRLAAEQVRAVLGETTTEWGLRFPETWKPEHVMNYGEGTEVEARRDVTGWSETPVLVNREVTPWIEVPS